MNTKAALAVFLSLWMLSGDAIADKNGNSTDRRYQTSNVIDASGAALPYQGAAWMIRSRDAVSGRIMTKVSTQGDPYTLWIVVFNNPGACDGPCDGSDLGTAEVQGSVFNGSGAISAASGDGGVLNIDFSVPASPLPSDLFMLIGDPRGLRKHNGFGAEIHLVIDKHPPVTAGLSWISDLTTTNFPGAGPNTGERVAVFVPCPGASCPDSVL